MVSDQSSQCARTLKVNTALQSVVLVTKPRSFGSVFFFGATNQRGEVFGLLLFKQGGPWSFVLQKKERPRALLRFKEKAPQDVLLLKQDGLEARVL